LPVRAYARVLLPAHQKKKSLTIETVQTWRVGSIGPNWSRLTKIVIDSASDRRTYSRILLSRKHKRLTN